MDKKTFTDMVLAEMKAVYRLAVYLSSAREADDLVQETYVRAFRSMATYKPTSEHGIRPWLFKILHNVYRNRLSGDQRRHAAMISIHEERHGSFLAEPVNRPTITHEVDWEQIDSRLRKSIESLPLQYKAIFLLSAVEGLRYKEIAAITDTPIGTVMSRLCRARALLSAELSSFAAEHGWAPRSEPGVQEATGEKQNANPENDNPDQDD